MVRALMGKVAYCTIGSANYMPQVLALEESVRRHRPGARFEVLLCERPEVVEKVSVEVGRRFFAPDEIGCTDWRRMASDYTITELNTALKPFFLRTLLGSCDAVVYLDPDVLVYGPLDELEELALGNEVVLTPHICSPLGDDGRGPSALDLNRAGQFNLGFIAVRSGARTDAVLRWWEDRCRKDCVLDPANGLFVDQSWANMLVSFLEAKVLRSESYNMAYWNVHQRALHREAGRFVTADGPLVFFHFSGLEPNRIEAVSRYQNRVRAEPETPLHAILSEYSRLLADSPWAAFRSRPYSLGRRDGGGLYLRVNALVKRAFPRLHSAAKGALSIRVRNRIKRLFV